MSAVAENAGVPMRVAQEIKQSLAEDRSQFRHGRLPSHRELCRMHRASLNTVRRALDLLEQEGVLYRRERSGTFISLTPPEIKPPPVRRLRCINFIEEHPPMWSVLKTEYLAGYTEALEHTDAKMRFISCPDDLRQYDGLLSRRLDPAEQGCVLINVAPPRLLRWLDSRGVPHVVQFYSNYPRTGLPPHHSVCVNKCGAAANAVRYLLELGHRRIGYIGPLESGRPTINLFDGYRAALLCAGVDPSEFDFMDFSSNEVEPAIGPVTRYLARERAKPVTAVFAATDGIAMALERAAAAQGIPVPRELSIMGFNDQMEAARAEPPLTTMAVPRRLLARTAVEMLLNVSDAGKQGEFQNRILECRPVVRQSTGPAR